MKTQQQTSGLSLKGSTQIIRELSVEEAMKLRPSTTISVAVILNVGFDRDESGKVLEIPEMLTVTEWQDYGNGYLVTKLPAGSMNYEDIDVFAAAIRELFSETGYVAQDWIVVRAVETSSTRPGETHFKVFLVGKNASKVGKPTEACIRNVERVPMTEVHLKMTHAQIMGLRSAAAQFKLFTAEFWYAIEKFQSRIPEWIPKSW
jgi:8-oxo-dGTP pyrophosphatase MutT (NUDIX family)